MTSSTPDDRQPSASAPAGGKPTAERHAFIKRRLETRRRDLRVASVEHLTPHMLRIEFVSEDLRDFDSPAADDHIKLFFPTSAGQVAMRDFTPRSFDPASGRLAIDFALHDTGPATEWAAAATVGDHLQIGGPRGTTIVPDDFDWYVLIGDEAAYPAMARRLEELRPGVPAWSFAIASTPEDIVAFRSQTVLTEVAVIRGKRGGDAERVLEALASFSPPPGDGLVWIAAEGLVARRLRQYFVEERGHPRGWVKAAGYWADSVADGGGRIED